MSACQQVERLGKTVCSQCYIQALPGAMMPELWPCRGQRLTASEARASALAEERDALREALEEICSLSGSKASDMVVACTVGHIALRALTAATSKAQAEDRREGAG